MKLSNGLTVIVPDMRGRGKPARLVTGRKNGERNHSSCMYIYVMCHAPVMLTLIPTGEPTGGPHCFRAKYLGRVKNFVLYNSF
jgi:hypothetical protein